MIKQKRFLFWATGCGVYASFMIGYLLVLTLLLPSMLVYEPEWVKVGSYAQYAVRRYSGERRTLVENGTYSWMIVSTRTLASGEVVATINETYTIEWKADQWSWGSSWISMNIPSTGRISDVNIKDGFPSFWFDRYYNDYLIGITVFRKSNALPSRDSFKGLGLEEVSIHGVTRPSVKLMLIPFLYESSTTSFWFDSETGLLLQFIGQYYATYIGFVESSVMILDNTNITSEATANNKATVDLLLVSPLFVVPSVGAATGLFLIRRRRRQFSSRFWFFFVLFNGIIMVSAVNFPFRSLSTILYFSSTYQQPVGLIRQVQNNFLGEIILNALFWFGVFAAAVFLIDRFAFPLIQRRPGHLLPSPTQGEFRPPISTVPRAGEFKYCKHCGNRLPGDAKFCTSCGKEQ